MKKFKILFLILFCQSLFALPFVLSETDKKNCEELETTETALFGKMKTDFDTSRSTLVFFPTNNSEEFSFSVMAEKGKSFVTFSVKKTEFDVAVNEELKIQWRFDNEAIQERNLAFLLVGSENRDFLQGEKFNAFEETKKSPFLKKMLSSKKLEIKIFKENDKNNSKFIEFDLKDFQKLWEKHKKDLI